MERIIDSSKLANGHLLETIRVFEDIEGRTQQKTQWLLIKKHSPEPNILDRSLTLIDVVRREFEVPVVAVLEGRFISETGELRFLRVLSPSELRREILEGKRVLVGA